MAIFMKLVINGCDFNFDKLQAVFNFGETSLIKKGDTFYNRFLKETKVFNENLFTVLCEFDSDFENSLESFVLSLEASKNEILKLSKNNKLML